MLEEENDDVSRRRAVLTHAGDDQNTMEDVKNPMEKLSVEYTEYISFTAELLDCVTGYLFDEDTDEDMKLKPRPNGTMTVMIYFSTVLGIVFFLYHLFFVGAEHTLPPRKTLLSADGMDVTEDIEAYWISFNKVIAALVMFSVITVLGFAITCLVYSLILGYVVAVLLGFCRL